jgi:hypothetical protein
MRKNSLILTKKENSMANFIRLVVRKKLIVRASNEVEEL